MKDEPTNPSFDRVQLFVPEGERPSKKTPVDLHDRWVIRLLALCGRLFGGATSYGRGAGVWASGKTLHWDRVTVIEAWIDPTLPGLARKSAALEKALFAMGMQLRQEAVGYIMNGKLRIMPIRG